MSAPYQMYYNYTACDELSIIEDYGQIVDVKTVYYQTSVLVDVYSFDAVGNTALCYIKPALSAVVFNGMSKDGTTVLSSISQFGGWKNISVRSLTPQ